MLSSLEGFIKAAISLKPASRASDSLPVKILTEFKIGDHVALAGIEGGHFESSKLTKKCGLSGSSQPVWIKERRLLIVTANTLELLELAFLDPTDESVGVVCQVVEVLSIEKLEFPKTGGRVTLTLSGGRVLHYIVRELKELVDELRACVNLKKKRTADAEKLLQTCKQVQLAYDLNPSLQGGGEALRLLAATVAKLEQLKDDRVELLKAQLEEFQERHEINSRDLKSTMIARRQVGASEDNGNDSNHYSSGDCQQVSETAPAVAVVADGEFVSIDLDCSPAAEHRGGAHVLDGKYASLYQTKLREQSLPPAVNLNDYYSSADNSLKPCMQDESIDDVEVDEDGNDDEAIVVKAQLGASESNVQHAEENINCLTRADCDEFTSEVAGDSGDIAKHEEESFEEAATLNKVAESDLLSRVGVATAERDAADVQANVVASDCSLSTESEFSATELSLLSKFSSSAQQTENDPNLPSCEGSNTSFDDLLLMLDTHSSKIGAAEAVDNDVAPDTGKSTSSLAGDIDNLLASI